MPVLHINSGELPGIGHVADPKDVFIQMLQRLNERFNVESVSIQAPTGSEDANCGSLGLDELAICLEVRPQEETGVDAGVFIEGKSGNHYPLFEVARRFIEAVNNMVGGYVLASEGDDDEEGNQEICQAHNRQEVPEDQPRDAQGPE